MALPVDQGEALGDKPHMRSGGLGGARCDLNGRRPQSPAQHRGVDPVDAVLCQQFGERPRSCVALLHEYPLRVGRRGPHFSGPSAGATLQGCSRRSIPRIRRRALLHEDPAGGRALLGTLRRGHTTGMKSKVHPRYKTKYRVVNWAAYNRALVRCGDVTVWLSAEAIAGWTPRRSGRRGGQRALLGSRHRGRPDPATPLPSPAAPSRRVPARPVRDDAPRPLRPRLYDALPAQSASDAPSATGPDCSAPGFLDSGLQVITSTLPRPARRNRVALGLDSDSRTSPASTARCTSVETRARRGGVPRSFRSSAPTRDSPLPCG